jgi:hypothetical protein
MATSDPFERHGITHLSPSSLRLYKDAPAVWVGKYMLHAPDEVGPGAWRGKAVEAGVDRLLFGMDGPAAVAAMQAQWDQDAQGIIEPDVIKEYDALHDFLVQARIAFDGLAIPLQRQARIELALPGISVPLVGYADWLWPETGTDLKTTWRIPSTPDPGHVEQVACYSMYHGVPFSLTYVSPKRWTRYEILPTVASDAYDRVIEAAHAIRSMLAHVDSAHDALSMFAPDYTSYYFRPAMAEAVRTAKAARVLPAEPRQPKLQVVEP